MSKLKTIGYELKDIAVIQAPVSYLNHRSKPNPFVEICGRKSYPIFVSPMASVTDQHNYKIWIENDLTPLVPRSVAKSENNPNGLTFEERMKIAEETFVSVSLSEAHDVWNYLNGRTDYSIEYPKLYICIDIAHGTLSDLYDICKKLTTNFREHIELMTGNIANPAAYSFYADCGIDWCRLSVGTGSRCTSSCNVSIHYPSATLIDNVNEERKKYAHSHNGNAPTKIILDGGVEWFDDIQKAICLGADAVMCGNIFARTEEACGKTKYARSLEDAMNGNYLSSSIISAYPDNTFRKFREYYGMSTRRAQKETGGEGNRTSEGISRPVPVEYPVAKWVDNMQSYLRSCMTYTNSHTIKEMQENAQVIILGGSGDSSYRK